MVIYLCHCIPQMFLNLLQILWMFKAGLKERRKKLLWIIKYMCACNCSAFISWFQKVNIVLNQIFWNVIHLIYTLNFFESYLVDSRIKHFKIFDYFCIICQYCKKIFSIGSVMPKSVTRECFLLFWQWYSLVNLYLVWAKVYFLS